MVNRKLNNHQILLIKHSAQANSHTFYPYFGLIPDYFQHNAFLVHQ